MGNPQAVLATMASCFPAARPPWLSWQAPSLASCCHHGQPSGRAGHQGQLLPSYKATMAQLAGSIFGLMLPLWATLRQCWPPWPATSQLQGHHGSLASSIFGLMLPSWATLRQVWPPWPTASQLQAHHGSACWLHLWPHAAIMGNPQAGLATVANCFPAARPPWLSWLAPSLASCCHRGQPSGSAGHHGQLLPSCKATMAQLAGSIFGLMLPL